MDFTRDDLNLLYEAVDRWEEGDEITSVISSMTKAAVTSRGQLAPEEMRKLHEESMRAFNAERKVRRERGVLIRAKIIMMRDSMDAQRVIDDAARAASKGGAL